MTKSARSLWSQLRTFVFLLVTTGHSAWSGSVQLDGTDDYVEIGHDAALAAEHFTIETWFKRSTGGTTVLVNTTTSYPLIARGNAANYFLGTDTGGRLHGQVMVPSGSRISVQAPAAVALNEWHHGAFSFDGAMLRLYVDGVQVAERVLTTAPAQTPQGTRIGQIVFEGQAYGSWSGFIAETRIWNHARSASEIAVHYREALKFAPGLIVRWGLDGTLPPVSDGANVIPVSTANGATYVADGPALQTLAPVTAVSGPPAPVNVTPGTPLNFSATVTDTDDSITRVEFYANHTKIGEDSSAPYELTWTPDSAGIHLVRAVAEDAAGHRNGSSAASSVAVLPSIGNEAIYLDGENGYADAGTGGVFTANQFTVEARFYLNGDGKPVPLSATGISYGSCVALVSRSSNASDFNYLLGIRPSDNLLVGGFGGSKTIIAGRTPISRGVWHHAAVTYDGLAVRLFLDGQLEAESAAASAPQTSGIQRVTIGAITTSTWNSLPTFSGLFQGAIDEVRIFNNPRSPGAIAALRNADLPTDEGLIARWGMHLQTAQFLPSNGAGTSGASLVPRAVSSGGPTVDASTPPSVALDTPPVNAIRDQPITLQAQVSSPPENVARVEFWSQSHKLGEDSEAPYSLSWSASPVGAQWISAMAVTHQGAVDVSQSPTVNVSPQTGSGGIFLNGTQSAEDFIGAAPTNEFTLECWFRREGPGVAGPFMFGHTNPAETILNLHGSPYPICVVGVKPVDNVLIAAFTDPTAPITLSGTRVIQTGVWHHVAFSYDGKRLRVYLDGTVEMEAAVVPLGSGQTFRVRIAKSESSNATSFRGHIDGVRLWNYARSASEIAGTKSQSFFTYPGLRASWAFNEGSGTTASGSGSSPQALSVPETSWTLGYSPPVSGIPPTVSITSPLPQSVVAAFNPFTFAVNASDSGGGSIARVEFYLGNEKVGEDFAAPFETNVVATKVGSNSLRAVAVDNDGLTTTVLLPITIDPPLGDDGLYFDGVDDVVSFGVDAPLAMPQFTIEAWVNRQGIGVGRGVNPEIVPILARGSSGTEFSYSLGIEGSTGKPLVAMRPSSGFVSTISVIGPNSIPIGEWHHLAATFDGNTLQLIVNGELAGSASAQTSPFNQATLRTGIGAFVATNGSVFGAFHGFIDDVRIWNHARNIAAISADRERTIFNDPTLVARWGFNEGTGNQTQNSQPTSIVGAISGARWTRGYPEPSTQFPSTSLTATVIPHIGQSIDLVATHAPGSTIVSMELLVNGVKTGETTTAPWSLPFTPTTLGRYVVTVISTTSDGVKLASNDLVFDVPPPAGSGAVFFDGVDDSILLPAREELSLATFTIEAWFRRESAGTVGSPYSSASESFTPVVSTGFVVGIRRNGTLICVDRSNTSANELVGTTIIPPGVWHHLAVTASGASVRIYLNGVLEASSSLQSIIRRVPVPNAILGTEMTLDGTTRGAFHGLLDEVRVWSTVRTEQEIAANYQKEIYNAPGLVARWGFTEASGTSALESGTYELHGTLRNGVSRTAGVALESTLPPAISLSVPADKAELSAPVTLSASVSGEPGETLSAAFYGREILRDANDFTIAVLPPLRNYTIPANGGTPATLETMMDWIVNNRVSQNIAFVANTGGVADEVSLSGWANASDAFARLENPAATGLTAGIPFGLVDRLTNNYEQIFPITRFQNRPWFGPTAAFNRVAYFRAGGVDMGVIQVTGTFEPSWFRSIVSSQPARQFIVLLPNSAGSTEINSAITSSPNVGLVLTSLLPGESRVIHSTGSNTYHAVAADYSNRPNGGDGWMRLLTFSPTQSRIHVRTFSPTRNEFETDGNSDFTIGWRNSLPFEQEALIASGNYEHGANPQVVWSAASAGRRYEWRAAVSDGFTTRPSNVREFTVTSPAGATPPSIALTAPTANQSLPFPNVVMVSATASSPDDAVERVELVVNGLPMDSDTTGPYNFFWIPGAQGMYQISVAAIDRRGLRSESSPVQVTVGPAASGTLSPFITTPLPNSTLYDFGTVPITAAAIGSATVMRVDFYVDGVFLGSDSVAPFTIDYAYSGSGRRSIGAIVHATNGSATAAFMTVSVTPSPIPTITRQPYLQMATPNAVTVCWRTLQNHIGRVRYGTSPDALTHFAEDVSTKTDHAIRLTGLQPNTRFYYGVGSASGIASGGDATTYFTTPPLPGRARSTRIWALGDFGMGNAGQLSTRDAYYNFTGTRDTDLILMLGDNAYQSGLDAEFGSRLFAVYEPMLRRTFAWPALGNHDTGGSTTHNPNYPYFSIFNLPTAGECGGIPSGTENYYSFDYANIHFICLDSMTTDRSPNGAMATWLRSDLEATTARWIIAFWHHPPYSKGGWDSDVNNDQIQMRTNFVPILEEYGVDLVLSGHSHNYERSWFMTGHYGLSSTFNNTMKKSTGLGRPLTDGPYVKDPSLPSANSGAVYIVAGNAAGLYSASLNHPAMAISLNRLGTLAIDVNGNQLDVRMVQASGTQTDTFTMVKPYSSTDTDADQIPDEYESEYGLNPALPEDANADSDWDGFSNLFEYQTGTDPNERNSNLSVRVTPGATGQFIVRFPSNTMKLYTVQRCNDLSAGTWTNVGPELRGTGQEMTVLDLPAAGVEKRFYRVRVR